jgi:hypothetical protein
VSWFRGVNSGIEIGLGVWCYLLDRSLLDAVVMVARSFY